VGFIHRPFFFYLLSSFKLCESVRKEKTRAFSHKGLVAKDEGRRGKEGGGTFKSKVHCAFGCLYHCRLYQSTQSHTGDTALSRAWQFEVSGRVFLSLARSFAFGDFYLLNFDFQSLLNAHSPPLRLSNYLTCCCVRLDYYFHQSPSLCVCGSFYILSCLKKKKKKESVCVCLLCFGCASPRGFDSVVSPRVVCVFCERL